MGLALKLDSGVAFKTDLGTTVNVLFFLGVKARDGVPRDNTAVEVGVLEAGVVVLVIGVGVLEIAVDVPKMDIGVLDVGVSVSASVFVPGAMGFEDTEGDSDILMMDTEDVLVMDTVFFLEMGACDTGGGVSILTGKSSVTTAEVGDSAAATLGYLSLPDCINFLMGILNFGLWELIIFSLICFSLASSIRKLGFVLLEPVFSSCVLLSSFRLALLSSSSSL